MTNLLLITTDQQRFDTIRAAGNNTIWTPHLDWLCRTGIRYSRAYSDSPVCVPARATIMTGRHAHSHKQVSIDGKTSPMAHMPTLPGLLTQHGFQTRAVGKMHFVPLRANYGFEHMEILPDYYRWIQRHPGAPRPKAHGLGENEMEPGFATVPDELSLTHWTVDRSIDFLETRDTTRPFFLWTSFSKPHPPFDPPRSFWDLYDGIPLPEPVYGDWSRNAEDIPQGFMGPTYMLNSAHTFAPEQLRAIRRAYYACISQIDYHLGLLFARLRELNLLESTWIVFTTDHGEMLGDHRMGAKTVFLEGSAHIPLLIRPPNGRQDQPAVDDRIACLADLMPTFLARADYPAAQFPSTNGLDLLGGSTRDHLIGECSGQHMILDGSWKYTFTADGGGELLFDLAADPMEQRNLIDDPATLDRLTELRARLAQSLRERNHPAAGLAAPQAVNLAPQPSGRVWPGFHSIQEPSDVLH